MFYKCLFVCFVVSWVLFRVDERHSSVDGRMWRAEKTTIGSQEESKRCLVVWHAYSFVGLRCLPRSGCIGLVPWAWNHDLSRHVNMFLMTWVSTIGGRPLQTYYCDSGRFNRRLKRFWWARDLCKHIQRDQGQTAKTRDKQRSGPF